MLVIASQNPGKLKEIAALPGAAGHELTGIAEFAGCPTIAEDGTSFEENAAIKAVKYSLWLKRDHGCWPLVAAEDSGLCIEGLLGWPGVQSARIAGTNEARIAAVLERAKDLASRAARFTAVTAIAVNGTLVRTFTAHAPGQLAHAPKGRGGFGYDPIFEDAVSGKTFAEMDPAEKNLLSHRGKAWDKLFHFLSAANSGGSASAQIP